MFEKFRQEDELIREYCNTYIPSRRGFLYTPREVVYNHFISVYPNTSITSNYLTRRLNEIYKTKVKLISNQGKMEYIFISKYENKPGEGRILERTMCKYVELERTESIFDLDIKDVYDDFKSKHREYLELSIDDFSACIENIGLGIQCINGIIKKIDWD